MNQTQNVQSENSSEDTQTNKDTQTYENGNIFKNDQLLYSNDAQSSSSPSLKEVMIMVPHLLTQRN